MRRRWKWSQFWPETLCPQVLQQRFGPLEIGGVKALGEPAVDRCEQLPRFSAFALLLPQATQGQCRAQFPRLGLLAVGHSESLLETGFRLGRVRDGLP